MAFQKLELAQAHGEGMSAEDDLVQKAVLSAAEALASHNQLRVSKQNVLPDVLVGPFADADISNLWSQWQESRVVVLCGIGGVGKTTLAKALLNKANQLDPTALCQFVSLDGTDACIMHAQSTLLSGMACKNVTLRDEDHGEEQLVEAISNKRILLVLDNVWRSQVARLLPKKLLARLAQGSKIFVTTREGCTADAFAGAGKVTAVEVECLSRQLSVELFCRHAYDQKEPPADEEDVVDAVVRRCAGLPMALEVVGRYIARLPRGSVSVSEVEEQVINAYNIQLSGRLEMWRTMFEGVAVSWNLLTQKEKDALLDVAWFLGAPWWRPLDAPAALHVGPAGSSVQLAGKAVGGQQWEHVSWFFGDEQAQTAAGEGQDVSRRSVLEGLCDKRMVRQVSTESGMVVGMHNVVLDFCKMGVKHQGLKRLQQDEEDAGDCSLADLLQEVPELEALQLVGWQLARSDWERLRDSKLRLLWVQEANLTEPRTAEEHVTLSSARIKWFRLQGQHTDAQSPPVHLEVEASALLLLELEQLHGLKRLTGLQQCVALRSLSVSHCSQLALLNLSGLASLMQLRLSDCAKLQDVAGVSTLTSLSLLHVSDCPALLLSAEVVHGPPHPELMTASSLNAGFRKLPSTKARDQQLSYRQPRQSTGGFPHFHSLVSYAGRQQAAVACRIRDRLLEQHPKISVFVDQGSLQSGDDVAAYVQYSLMTCNTAVVVLSPEFIRKPGPMRELHILLQRVRARDVGLLVVLYGGITSLQELASMEESYSSKGFWDYRDDKGQVLKSPDEATRKQWAQDLRDLQGCHSHLIEPDQWKTIDELAAHVETGVADLLHARGQLPPRMEIFSTIPPPLWLDLEVRQREAQQAEAALLEHRYVELWGGPGEGKSTLAQYLTQRLFARWERWPPDGSVGKMCLALEVDVRGLSDVDSLKEVVASQVLAAASVVGLQHDRHSFAPPSDGQQSAPQETNDKQWLELMSWVLSRGPCPLLLLLENAEDAIQHKELPEVVVRLRALPHMHLIVATRAHSSLSEQVGAPAELCTVDLGTLDTMGGLRVMEVHLGRGLQAGQERVAATQLVEAVQANPLFCGVAACLVKQTGRTWEELLELCKQDMELVKRRAGGMRRRLVLLQRWLRSALGPQEQLFLAHLSVFAGSFTAAGAAAMQLPDAAVASQQEHVATALGGECCIDADTASVQLHAARLTNQVGRMQQQQQQYPPASGKHLLAREPDGKAWDSSPGTEDILKRLQLLSLIKNLTTHNVPSSYSLGRRWMMHALVQQAALKLLQDGGNPGHSQQAAAEQLHDGGVRPEPVIQDPIQQLYNRFTEWMLWHPEGPGQALVRCEPTGGQQPDAKLMWFLLSVEQANLHAAAAKLPDLQALDWQGESGINRARKVDWVGNVLANVGQYLVALQLRSCMVNILTINHGARAIHTLALQANLAITLQEMGQLAEARKLQEEVLAARTQLLGPAHPDTLNVKNNLASTLQEMGQLGEARQLQEEVLTASIQRLGPEHADTLVVKSNLANTLQDLGQLGEARELQEEVLAARMRLLGPEHPDALSIKHNLADTLHKLGRLKEAQQLQEEVLAAGIKLLGREHPHIFSIKSNLAVTLQAIGQLGDARQLQEEVLAGSTQLLGPEHPGTLSNKNNLASTLYKLGQVGQAQQLQQELLVALTQLLGPVHPETLSTKDNLAITLQAMGQVGEARQLQEEVLADSTQLLGPEHVLTLSVKSNLASTLQACGQLGEARELQEEVLAARMRLFGPEHPGTLSVQGNLANTLQDLGQLGEARQLQEEVLAATARLFGPEYPETLRAKINLAITLQLVGQPGEAQQLQEEVLAASTQLLGPEHLLTLGVKSDLANTLQDLGQLEKAQHLQEEVLAARTRLLGPDHPHTLGVKSNLASTLQAMGKQREAVQLQEEVLEAWQQLLGAEHTTTLTHKGSLASMLQAMGRLKEARQLQEEVVAASMQLLGAEHPRTIETKLKLASTLASLGLLNDSCGLQEEVLAAKVQVLGHDHHDTLSVKDNLAATLLVMGCLQEAWKLQEEVVDTRMRLLGPAHHDTLMAKSSLVSTLAAMGQLEQAQHLQEELQQVGSADSGSFSVKNNMVDWLVQVGRLADAQQLQAEVLTEMLELLGPMHADTLRVKNRMVGILQSMGRVDEAKKLQQEVLTVMEQVVGPEDLGTLRVKNNIALLLQLAGQLDEAQQLQLEVLHGMQRLMGPEHPDVLQLKSSRAMLLQALGRLEETCQLQEEVCRAKLQLLGPEHHETNAAKNDLANTLQAMGQIERARQLKQEVVEVLLRELGPNHRDTLTAITNLASTRAHHHDNN